MNSEAPLYFSFLLDVLGNQLQSSNSISSIELKSNRGNQFIRLCYSIDQIKKNECKKNVYVVELFGIVIQPGPISQP